MDKEIINQERKKKKYFSFLFKLLQVYIIELKYSNKRTKTVDKCKVGGKLAKCHLSNEILYKV